MTHDIRGSVLDLVRTAVIGLNQELGYDSLNDPTEETVLHGDDGLDSLSLVTLVVDLEGMVAERFGADVVLADEKAMSQRTSPYRTVGSLAEFIAERLERYVA
jgi:acyl carrier protein